MREVFKPARSYVQRHKVTVALGIALLTSVGVDAGYNLNAALHDGVPKGYFDKEEKRPGTAAWPNFKAKNRIEAWCKRDTLVIKSVLDQGFDSVRDYEDNQACNDFALDTSVKSKAYDFEHYKLTFEHAFVEAQGKFDTVTFSTDDALGSEPMQLDQTD